MKLLDRLGDYGYKVSDVKRGNGARIICISGKGAWVRCVFRPGCTLETARMHVAFLQRSVRNLMATEGDRY